MRRLRWLTSSAVVAIHDELIATYGGSHGLRDRNLLDSAMAGPKHLAAYGKNITVPGMAAAYCWGLLRNHPFIDGNKRAAFAAAVMFLDLNGWELVCSEAEETAMVLAAANGEVKEQPWRAWVQRAARKKPK